MEWWGMDAARWQGIWQSLTETLVRQGLNIVLAIVILLAGWWIAGRARRAAERLFERGGVDVTVRPMMGSIVLWVFRIITLVLVLSQFGVQTASIIAILGAAGLAIGLALQGTLQNIAAGIMIVILRPFRVGDYIDAERTAGTVREIGLFMTELTMLDGVCLHVPNNKLWGSPIINYSANPTRRLDIEVGVHQHDDIGGAITALRTMLIEEPRVLDEPAPDVMVMRYAEGTIILNVRCWIATSQFWPVRFELNRRVKEVVEQSGCSIPLPQRELRVVESSNGAGLPSAR
jgi:small conductance mechanosensitive channel